MARFTHNLLTWQRLAAAGMMMDGYNTLSRCDLAFITSQIGGIEQDTEYIADLASYHKWVKIYR